eukprot:9325687-Lingulodinium_polyedra.AAC.1
MRRPTSLGSRRLARGSGAAPAARGHPRHIRRPCARPEPPWGQARRPGRSTPGATPLAGTCRRCA